MSDTDTLPSNQLPPLPVSHLIASFALQPAPPVHAHTIGITAFAQFSSPIRIPQLIHAVDLAAGAHLALAPASFAKAFDAKCLPGISDQNPSLAACAVVDARKRNLVTDAKFVITKPGFPKVRRNRSFRITTLRAYPPSGQRCDLRIRLFTCSLQPSATPHAPPPQHPTCNSRLFRQGQGLPVQMRTH